MTTPSLSRNSGIYKKRLTTPRRSTLSPNMNLNIKGKEAAVDKANLSCSPGVNFKPNEAAPSNETSTPKVSSAPSPIDGKIKRKRLTVPKAPPKDNVNQTPVAVTKATKKATWDRHVRRKRVTMPTRPPTLSQNPYSSTDVLDVENLQKQSLTNNTHVRLFKKNLTQIYESRGIYRYDVQHFITYSERFQQLCEQFVTCWTTTGCRKINFEKSVCSSRFK